MSLFWISFLPVLIVNSTQHRLDAVSENDILPLMISRTPETVEKK
jgi:hypothetical protein